MLDVERRSRSEQQNELNTRIVDIEQLSSGLSEQFILNDSRALVLVHPFFSLSSPVYAELTKLRISEEWLHEQFLIPREKNIW